MAVPVPAEVLEVVVATAQDLRGVRPGLARKLHSALGSVETQLMRSLNRIDPNNPAAVRQRLMLAQIRASGELVRAEITGQLTSLGRVAAQIGRDGLVGQLQGWRKVLPGFDPDIRLAQTAQLLDSGLLEYYATSAERYGQQLITRMRGELALGVLRGQTVGQLTNRLQGAFGFNVTWAERIVRTETSFAAHRREIVDLRQVFGDEASGWRKQLVTVFDNRTGSDSIRVDGQIRKLDEDFYSPELGVSFPHPPDRPNDRGAMVLVPPGV